MLPHKKDHYVASVPVSRVGLSVKLNHLNIPTSSRPNSRPNTPGAYVASSLNPTRNTPITPNSIRSKIGNTEDAERFEALSIVKGIRDFEVELMELSQSISSFKEEHIPGHIERLIEANKEIFQEQQNLRKHQSLGVEIERLQQENDDLSRQSTHILKELISCRAELKKLPGLPTARDSSKSTGLKEIGVQELLDYSMKLAKFSKAPTIANGTMPHPNNFIWPAEDALRRGVLALSSLKADEILKAELGETVAEETKEEEDEDVEMEDVENLGSPAMRQSRPSEAPRKLEPARAPEALNLDLFDGDDSDDSD